MSSEERKLLGGSFRDCIALNDGTFIFVWGEDVKWRGPGAPLAPIIEDGFRICRIDNKGGSLLKEAK